MSIPGGALATGGRVLAPSRSTVYVSNLPFSLTNNDLTKVFEKFGKIVRVTIVRNKETHKSKGVAFILYLNKEEAASCVQSTNGSEMFGRTLKASIAQDNGRATEFIRRKEYPDKSRCYECGEDGHMSYKCPKNLLGDREPPKKKPRKRKKDDDKSLNNINSGSLEDDEDQEDEDEDENFEDESLSAAIKYQQELRLAEEFQSQVSSGGTAAVATISSDNSHKKMKIKKSAYFSDEEELSD